MRSFLLALACLLLAHVVSAVNLQKRRAGLRSHTVHHKRAHGKTHQLPTGLQGWSMPPLTKIFRGSEKTASSLESNMARLKESVNDLRKKDLDDAKEVYAQFAQALSLDDEQNQKLQANNDEDQKKIDALELSNKAEEVRRDNLVKENQKLYKQLEELKKTVNSQVNGLEDILKDGVSPPNVEASAPVAAAPVVPVNLAAQPQYCHCTKACFDQGWGPWCPVQSATCVTKTPCATGGAAGACVTVDQRDGPWTRCENIIQPEAVAANFLQVSSQKGQTKEDDEDDADDGKDSDEEDDDEDEICQCKQPCTDLGWGMWCYVQSSTCKVRTDCDMGGAAHACVASDPAGPWTRCSNLLPVPPKQAAKSIVPQQTVAAALPPVAIAASNDISVNTKPVKDILVKMMTQVDDIRQQDEVSMQKLRELFQQEQKKEMSVKESIAAKKEELASQLREVKEESTKLAQEVEHLEEVNRNLHTQLRRLERFLASASTELKGSMETDDRMTAAAIQLTKKSKKDVDDEEDAPKAHKKMSKKDDDDDEDDDDDKDDDDDSKDEEE